MSKTAKKWSICLTIFMTLLMAGLVRGQCPMDNAIVGANEVCPGSQTVYSVTMDVDPLATYSWQLLNGGGQFVGPTTGVTATIDWQAQNGGPFTIRVTIQLPTCTRFFELAVEVADDFVRYPFNCFGEVNIPLDNNCEKLIEPQHLLTSGIPDCPGTYQVSLSIDDNIPIPNPVTIEYADQIITATITHPPTGRSCVSLINLTDATEPILMCENDTTICNDPYVWDPFLMDEEHGFKQPVVFDNCEDDLVAQPDGYEWISLFSDPYFAAYVIRSWRAVDKYDNVGLCMDTIFLRRIIFDSIQCPPDTTILCDDPGFDPSDPLTAGVPTFEGYPVYSEKSFCNIGIEYADRVAHHCPGSYTIYRDWILADLDAPTVVYDSCHQIIEVIDTVGPKVEFHDTAVQLERHEDLFGVHPDSLYKTIYFPTLDYTCLAHGYFPTPYIIDACSPSDSVVVDLSWDNGHINYLSGTNDGKHLKFDNLSQGKHIVTITARDLCHNITIDTLIAVAKDIKAPFITLDRYPVVTLGDFADVTWVDVSTFDEGTWDNCNLYAILARRTDWETACGYTADTSQESAIRSHYDTFWEWLKNDNELCFDSLYTYVPRKDTLGHDTEYDTIPNWYGWSNQVPFCCADACSDEKVTLEILAIDASCNIARLWVDVEVEDKSVPEVKIPLPDLTISCYAYNHYYKDSVEKGNYDVFGKYELFASTPYSYGAGKTVIKDRICTEYSDDETDHYIYVSDTIDHGLILENCRLVIKETQKMFFEKCGEGWIERQFVLKGACQSSKADSTKVFQRINIVNDCPLYESDIIWPNKDTSIYSCGYVDLETQGPRMKYDDPCRQIGIHHKDMIVDQLFNADSTCLKIIRKWAVIDWCRQTAAYHEDWIGDQQYHYYEFDQIIYVKNREGPVLENCNIDTICIGGACSATLDVTLSTHDDCTPTDQIEVSWSLYEQSDYGYLPLDKGLSRTARSHDLQIGSYKLIWTAVDRCGNETLCADEFDVVDCVKPSPVCLGSTTVKLLPIDLNYDGLVDTAISELWAEELDISSYDNCGDEITDFRIRIQGTGQLDGLGNLLPPDTSEVKLSLGCQDIGTLNVEFWVVDSWGNADYCQALVEIQGPIEGCQEEVGVVKGKVSSMKGSALSSVVLNLNGEGMSWETHTNERGQYSFTTHLQENTSYALYADKVDTPIDGISTLDILKVSKHILSASKLNTFYERLAADVNEDGRISVADMITMRKFILGKIDRLPTGRMWHFFNTKLQEESTLSLQEDYQGLLDFTGVKLGDVTGDAGAVSPRRKRSTQPMYELSYVNKKFTKGERFTVALTATKPVELQGLQIQLLLDERYVYLSDVINGPFESQDVYYHDLNSSINFISYKQGQSTYIPQNGQVLVLAFTALRDGDLDHVLALSGTGLKNELYDHLDSTYQLTLSAIELNGNQFSVGTTAPNPFITSTSFAVSVPANCRATLTLYEIDGRKIHSERLQLHKGTQTLQVDGRHFQRAGIFLYEVETPWGSIAQKFVYSGG